MSRFLDVFGRTAGELVRAVERVAKAVEELSADVKRIADAIGKPPKK